MNEVVLTAAPDQAGKRIDSWLAEQIDGLTRSAAQNLLAENAVVCGGQPLKKNYKLAGGETVTVRMPELREVDITPENIPLDIIYEDADIIVVNKPRGMVVHPAAGNWSGTLVNALMYHCGDRLSGINGEHRPGIVHRIDKDTSGLLVVAKNDAAHQSLAAQIAAHTAFRGYEAIVVGSPRLDEGTIDKPIARHKTDRKKMAVVKEGGRDAITDYEVLERFGKYTLVRCKLRTGRTHQIRVHMEYLGYPLVGDPKYSPMKTPFGIKGQALHSHTLEFTHPRTGECMKFEAPLPEDMHKIITRLHNGQF